MPGRSASGATLPVNEELIAFVVAPLKIKSAPPLPCPGLSLAPPLALFPVNWSETSVRVPAR
jgi:hypothetical protein